MPRIPRVFIFFAVLFRLIAFASQAAGGDPELANGAATLLMIMARWWPRTGSNGLQKSTEGHRRSE
jgi:hypothetical protein